MKRKLRIPLLLLGIYLIFMGIAEIIMSRWAERAETTRRLLVLFGDGRYERLPFFAERDLELTAEGLARGDYVRAELYLEGWRYLLFPEHREEGASDPPRIFLQMIYRLGNRSMVYEKKGSVSQAQERLADLCQGGWNPFGWTEGTT